MKEETGIDCEITGLIGIYTDPGHIILYTSNNEARQEFSILLRGRPVASEPAISDESLDVQWIPPESLGGLPMDQAMRFRLSHRAAGAPYLG